MANNDYDPNNADDNSMGWLFAGIVVFVLVVGAFFLIPATNTGNNLSTIEPAAGSNTLVPDDATGGYTAPAVPAGDLGSQNNAIPPQPVPAEPDTPASTQP